MGNKSSKSKKREADFWETCYSKREWKQSLKIGDMIDVLHMDKRIYIPYKITKLNTTGDRTLYLEREFKQRKNNIFTIETEKYTIVKWNGSTLMHPYGTKTSDYKDEDIDTLHYNIANGNNIKVKEMIEYQKNEIDHNFHFFFINKVDPKYGTPLLCALQNNYPDIALLLLNSFEIDIDPNLYVYRRTTPLSICCDKKYFKVIDKLFTFDPFDVNIDGQPCISYVVQKNDVEILKVLLEHFENKNLNINMTNSTGNTAIYCACYCNCVNALDLLLSKGCDPNVTIATGSGNTAAINIAISNGFDDIINRLLQYNDTVKPINFNNIEQNGETCLMHACRKGKYKLVEKILNNNGDPSIITHDHKTAIYYSISGSFNNKQETEENRMKIIKLLLSHSNNPPITIDDLCFAIKKKKIEIVKLLVNKLNLISNRLFGHVDINSFSNSKQFECTPLYTAVQWGNDEIVKFLLENGANAALGTNKYNGETPINKAAKMGKSLCIYYLLRYNAEYNFQTFYCALRSNSGDALSVKYLYEHKNNTFIKDINMRHESTNCTPLMIAIKGGNPFRRNSKFAIDNTSNYIKIDIVIISYLRNIKKEEKYLNIPNIIVYIINEYSVTMTIFNLLLKYGADILINMPDGSTILNEYIRRSHSESAVKCIINELQKTYEKREDLIDYIYKHDRDNKNALIYACEKNRYNIIKLLIEEYDANIWQQDKNGEYLFEIACDRDHYTLSEYIMNLMHKHKKSTKQINTQIKETKKSIKKKKEYERTHNTRCFDGNGKVLMNNGTYKLIKDLCIGDNVKTLINGFSKIKCIQISELNRTIRMVYIAETYDDYSNGFWITFQHPILLNKNDYSNGGILKTNNINLKSLGINDINKYNLEWVLPKDINDLEWRYQDKVYNFVLENNHTLNVNGFWCITLGHDFKGEGIEHEFYGNSKAIDSFLRQSHTYPICIFDF